MSQEGKHSVTGPMRSELTCSWKMNSGQTGSSAARDCSSRSGRSDVVMISRSSISSARYLEAGWAGLAVLGSGTWRGRLGTRRDPNRTSDSAWYAAIGLASR